MLVINEDEKVEVSRTYLKALEDIQKEYFDSINTESKIYEISNNVSPFKQQWNRQRTRSILAEWYYFDHNINILDNIRLSDAKSLYYRLTYLTENERSQLAYMFYYNKHSDVPGVKDIAAKYNLLNASYVTEFRNNLIDKLRTPRFYPKDANNTDEKIKAKNKRIKEALQLLLPEDKRD